MISIPCVLLLLWMVASSSGRLPTVMEDSEIPTEPALSLHQVHELNMRIRELEDEIAKQNIGIAKLYKKVARKRQDIERLESALQRKDDAIKAQEIIEENHKIEAGLSKTKIARLQEAVQDRE